ncbi:MAG: c-type cytochrome [Phycisphaerales bacterium]|nr:c-type cytochrome [Phycisphaerales bacterium]
MNMPLLASTNMSFLQRIFFGNHGASEAAAWSDGLFMMIFWFSAVCFVILMALMVIFVVKYRRKPGVAAQPSPHHNLNLEILWTVVPSASMLVMFVLGFEGYAMKMVAPDSAMELKVDAWKWAWKVTYPNGASSPETKYISFDDNMLALEAGEADALIETMGLEYPIFYVPEDTAVKLRMHSQDVIHSFWIPEFRTKMDVMPNRYTGYGFQTPKLKSTDMVLDQTTMLDIPGRDMWIFCAEYCGDEHSRMAATLRIVPQEIYEAKIKEWGTPKDPIELGKTIHKTMCAICHSVDGSPGTGPTWKSGNGYGFGYDAALADGTTAPRDANYLRESILDPNAKVVAGYVPAMPSFQGQLSDVEIDGLIAYMQSLSDLGPNQEETNEETPEAADTAGSESP